MSVNLGTCAYFVRNMLAPTAKALATLAFTISALTDPNPYSTPQCYIATGLLSSTLFNLCVKPPLPLEYRNVEAIVPGGPSANVNEANEEDRENRNSTIIKNILLPGVIGAVIAGAGALKTGGDILGMCPGFGIVGGAMIDAVSSFCYPRIREEEQPLLINQEAPPPLAVQIRDEEMYIPAALV